MNSPGTALFQLIFSIFLLLVNENQLVSSAREERIIGGEDAYVGQFPFAAAVYIETADGRYFCGGALMTSEWIITAAHCVNNGILFTIHLGSNHLTADDPNRITVASSEYYIHPEFNPDTIENDVALIKLRMPVTLNEYVQPIYLPTVDLSNYTTVTVLGWGQTSDSDAELSENLKHVTVGVLSNVECQLFYGDQIKENMACVQGNFNEGTCTGDNGGALVEYLSRYYWLVGIASFVSGNGCESTDPSGYTRTFPYTSWIGSIIYGETA